MARYGLTAERIAVKVEELLQTAHAKELLK